MLARGEPGRYVSIMGVFLTFTALTILVPLQAEIRSADRNARELASPILLALGLLVAGLGLWLAPDQHEAALAGSGVVLCCAGLVLRPGGIEPPARVSAVSADQLIREESSA
ncbi:MAG: hypothetical protein L0271_17545 [Gemmatimonadetes bacterium]|nr:hypothetical protein [Gemmatimonadota bacterium]